MNGTSKRAAIPNIPQDAAWHDKRSVTRAARVMMSLYAPWVKDREFTVEPGDIVIISPAGGGPGHILVAGALPNTLYHAITTRVQRTGCMIVEPFVLTRIYRPTYKKDWLNVSANGR